MAAVTLNFNEQEMNSCEAGASFRQSLNWFSASGPVDLTGYTAIMQVRVYTQGRIITTLSTDNGKIEINMTYDSHGTLVCTEIVLMIAATETKHFPEGEFVYDLKLIASDGQSIRLTEGSFVVTPEISD